MGSYEWHTRILVVGPSRALMGGIDVDPASCEEANRVVRASTFYTKKEDGLTKPWPGSVFLNPPGGKAPQPCYTLSYTVVWWDALVERYLSGETTEAIFVAFNVDALSTCQTGRSALHPLHLPVCVPKSRLRFNGPADQPRFPSAIVYLPNRSDPDSVAKFVELFSHLGDVTAPYSLFQP